MSVTLTSISPLSGSPGAAITCTGTGFDAGAQVGCPTLVATTCVNSTTLTAAIPWGVSGPAGGSAQIGVYVLGSDGSTSAVLMFTVEFPSLLQSWTKLDPVVGEVPGFQRGGLIKDSQINTWIRSVAQEIAAEMMRRGLSLDPTTWQQANSAAEPSPADVLEVMNRMGAAARLAAAISSQFTTGGQDWAVTKNLNAAYLRMFDALRDGDYDKFFDPGAATVDASPGLEASTGRSTITMEKVF
jgi:hypothetical protein